jgi:hypothetical protein
MKARETRRNEKADSPRVGNWLKWFTAKRTCRNWKRFSGIDVAVILLFAALNVNAMGYLPKRDPAPDPVIITAPTNETGVETVTPPSATVDTIAVGSFSRPSIAVDGETVYVACEGPKMQSLYQWTRTAGTWFGGIIVKASPQTAMRTYVADTLPGFTSFRYGKKDGGKFHGPGLFADGKESFVGLTTGAARLAMSKDGPILMSKNGEWKNLRTGQTGKYNAGSTGEKYDFAIQDGKWATVVNGYSKDPSSISYDGKRVVAFDYNTFKDQGSDLNYPSILIHSGAVWMASVHSGRLRLQCLKDGKLRWSATKPANIGDATMQQRCPPRLTAIRGRVVAVWQYKGSIMQVDVENALAGQAKPVAVCRGTMPDVSGPHMVYLDGGAVKHRTLKGE